MNKNMNMRKEEAERENDVDKKECVRERVERKRETKKYGRERDNE